MLFYSFTFLIDREILKSRNSMYKKMLRPVRSALTPHQFLYAEINKYAPATV